MYPLFVNYLDISHLNHVYSVDVRLLKYTEVKVILLQLIVSLSILLMFRLVIQPIGCLVGTEVTASDF